MVAALNAASACTSTSTASAAQACSQASIDAGPCGAVLAAERNLSTTASRNCCRAAATSPSACRVCQRALAFASSARVRLTHSGASVGSICVAGNASTCARRSSAAKASGVSQRSRMACTASSASTMTWRRQKSRTSSSVASLPASLSSSKNGNPVSNACSASNCLHRPCKVAMRASSKPTSAEVSRSHAVSSAAVSARCALSIRSRSSSRAGSACCKRAIASAMRARRRPRSSRVAASVKVTTAISLTRIFRSSNRRR